MAYNLDQSYTAAEDASETTGNLRIAADNNQILGQSFTPVLLGQLNRIELYIKKEGTPTGNIWLEIHADGANPTAAAQQGSDSATLDVSSISTSYGYVAFDFASPITLTPGTEYWILLYGDYTYSSTDDIIWAIDQTSPTYNDGIFGRFGNGTETWEDLPTYDALFKQYSDNVAGGMFLNNLL